jgi:hypothetical protein
MFIDALPSIPKQARALTAEIIGGCLGTSVITGILVYWAIKKFKGNTRNFKPNGSDPA